MYEADELDALGARGLRVGRAGSFEGEFDPERRGRWRVPEGCADWHRAGRPCA